jgi:hypothetical protein
VSPHLLAVEHIDDIEGHFGLTLPPVPRQQAATSVYDRWRAKRGSQVVVGCPSCITKAGWSIEDHHISVLNDRASGLPDCEPFCQCGKSSDFGAPGAGLRFLVGRTVLTTPTAVSITVPHGMFDENQTMVLIAIVGARSSATLSSGSAAAQRCHRTAPQRNAVIEQRRSGGFSVKEWLDCPSVKETC